MRARSADLDFKQQHLLHGTLCSPQSQKELEVKTKAGVIDTTRPSTALGPPIQNIADLKVLNGIKNPV